MKTNTNLVYGLDFGTSNSAVAVLDQSGQSKVIKIGINGVEKTIPSVLFFPAERMGTFHVGDTAILEYVKSKMKGRFLQSIKSILPSKSFASTNIPGFGPLSSEDLISLILKSIKERADSQLKADVRKVVLGRPARFSDDAIIDLMAEQRLLKAAKKAGFEEINFQLEPIAAALHYESYLSSEKLVLVVDIGGGTSDFTIMKLSPKKTKFTDRQDDILSSNGLYIGGDNFDSDIMKNKLIDYFGYGSNIRSYEKILPFPNHLLLQICKWQDIGFLKSRRTQNLLKNLHHSSESPEKVLRLQSLINEDLGYSLFCEIEKSKITLSNFENSTINFRKSVIDIKVEITKNEFEGFIAHKLAEINKSLNEAIDIAGVNYKSIDAVFMTGGSSLIPALRKIVSDKFGEHKIAPSDSFTSVVSGLALSTKLFF
jgi:hypothetical chaperone protein